jgi:hypothetical protein
MFDIKEQVESMFDILGTPAEHKGLILFDIRHRRGGARKVVPLP